MDHLGKRLPETLSQFSNDHSPTSELEQLARLEIGLKSAKAIITRYPEYGKAPPEYLAGLAKLLATYPDDVLKTMTDIRIGISARYKFLPTPAEIVEYGEQLEERRAGLRDVRRGRVPEPIGHGMNAQPFPRLFAVFRNHPELLARSFETLFDASRALATEGDVAARTILVAGKSIR